MRRERLIQHNTQLTCLFQPSKRSENSVNPEQRFGLDRARVLVYLQALKGSSIGSRMSQKSGLMQGKRGVILGVANNRTGGCIRLLQRPTSRSPIR
jgi:hypothetical protein